MQDGEENKPHPRMRFFPMQRNMAARQCYTRRHAFPNPTCENPALVARLTQAARFHTA
jgi:hypothetical protein